MRRPGLWHGLGEDILQFQGQAAVLPLEAGNAQPLGAPDGGVQLAGLSDVQVGQQSGMAGQDVLETNFRTGGQLIQGVQGIRTEMAADHSDFHTLRSLLFYSNGFNFASHTYVSLFLSRG